MGAHDRGAKAQRGSREKLDSKCRVPEADFYSVILSILPIWKGQTDIWYVISPFPCKKSRSAPD